MTDADDFLFFRKNMVGYIESRPIKRNRPTFIWKTGFDE